MIRLPDRRRPGVFFEIENPKSIIAGCRLRDSCSICELLKRAMREANATLPPVPLSTETGFEVSV